MVAWIHDFFVPLIEIVFIGGIVGFVSFFIARAFWNVWSKQLKFFFKYKIRRKPYPEKTIKWVMDCMEKGIGYYDAKQMLYVAEYYNETDINETLYIYDQIINELNNQKGGSENGKKFKRGNSRNESKELPTI